jgi:DNA-binding MarR family transcriptional regulator
MFYWISFIEGAIVGTLGAGAIGYIFSVGSSRFKGTRAAQERRAGGYKVASSPGAESQSTSTASANAESPPEHSTNDAEGIRQATNLAVSASTPLPQAVGSGSSPDPERADLPIGSSTASRPDVLLSRRVLLHLLNQPRWQPGELPPPGSTQRGMQDALESRQSALSKVLRRLTDAEVLSVSRQHVQGESRRLKTYHLTPKGETIARTLKSQIRDMHVYRTRSDRPESGGHSE